MTEKREMGKNFKGEERGNALQRERAFKNKLLGFGIKNKYLSESKYSIAFL